MQKYNSCIPILNNWITSRVWTTA